MTVLAPLYFVYAVRGTGLKITQIMAVTLPATAVAILAAALTHVILPRLTQGSAVAQLILNCALYGLVVGALFSVLFMLNATYRATLRRAAQVLPLIRKRHRS